MLMILIFICGVLIGLRVGKSLTEYKWTTNARRVYRIESGGRLYKVEFADEERKEDSDED